MTTPNTARVETGLVPQPNQFDQLRATIDRLEQEQSSPDGARDAAKPARRATRNRKDQQMNQTTVTAAVTPAGAKPNSLTFTELLTIATDLGAEAGKGKDVQVKLDLKVLEGAFVGQLDLQPNKHGDEISDAVKLAEAYVRAQNSAVIFDAKAPNQRRLVSNLNKMIKLGTSPKWGVGEPMQNVNDLMTLRQNLRRTANKGVRLDDAHNTLMRYATTQLKSDTLISDPNQMKAFCLKKDSDPRTAEEVLRSIQKIASALKSGKVSNCPDTDNSPEVSSIINACNKRITQIVKAKAGDTSTTQGNKAA